MSEHDLPQAVDDRPEYNPTALVADVEALLRRSGVEVDLSMGRLSVAVHAAADLLRALGVRPASAPICTKGPDRRGDVS